MCSKCFKWGVHTIRTTSSWPLLYRTNSGNISARDLKTQFKTRSLLVTSHASNNVLGSLGNYLYILICKKYIHMTQNCKSIKGNMVKKKKSPSLLPHNHLTFLAWRFLCVFPEILRASKSIPLSHFDINRSSLHRRL